MNIDVPGDGQWRTLRSEGMVLRKGRTRFRHYGKFSRTKAEITDVCLRLVKQCPERPGGNCIPEIKKVKNFQGPPPSTKVTTPVAKGAKTLPVVSNGNFQVGEEITLDAGTPVEESNTIKAFGSLILAEPLEFDHAPGATATAIVDEEDLIEDAEENEIVETFDDEGNPAPEAAPTAGGTVEGATASLDAAGFKAVTSLCCPWQMQVFFERLLDAMGLYTCSTPHLQGLMHWFHCVPNMDFQYVIDVINNGNPCKYWQVKGQDCPVLTPECQGKWCR